MLHSQLQSTRAAGVAQAVLLLTGRGRDQAALPAAAALAPIPTYVDLAAALADPDGPRAKLARYYVNALLPEHVGLLAQAQKGADDLFALSIEEMAV